MQLGNKGIDATTSGTAGKLTTMKISANAVSFNILSSSLYNDIIRAPIRELSCNAFDAHTAAGKAHIPFEVHLPTYYEPYFSVRDNGTGLKFIKGGCEYCGGTGCLECNGTGDYDATVRLYCTYFSSDKNNSDDMIGGFGLGSKSPFAYTNKRKADGTYQSGGFTVTNRYEGKTYIYSAAVKHGIPSVVLMGISDSPTESNGVEVSFPVENQDIWEFENKAASVFEFFNPRPILNKPLTIAEATYSIKTDLWGMRNDDNGLRAIMGNVQYSVGDIDQSRLTPAQQKMMEMSIDLFFNIGEINPAVSRESLQLDDTTIAALLKRLEVVQDNLMDEIRKQVDACPTMWEAKLKIHALTMQSGMGTLVRDAYSKGLMYGSYTRFNLLEGGKSINTVVINELDYHSINLMEFRTNDRRKAKKAVSLRLFGLTEAKKTAALRDIYEQKETKDEFDILVDVNEKTVFIINDLKTAGDRYIHYMLQTDTDNPYRKALVVTRAHKMVDMARVGDEGLVMLDKMGNPPVMLVSELKVKYGPLMKEQREINKSTPRERITVRTLVHYMPYSRRASKWGKAWENGKDALGAMSDTETKYYILLNKQFEPEMSDFYSRRKFVEFVSIVRASNLFPEVGTYTPIFGIRKDSKEAKLLTDHTFVEFYSFVKARVEATLTPAKEMELSLAVKPFFCDWAFILEYIAQHPQVLSVDSPIRQFAMALNVATSADRSGHDSLVTLAHHFNINISNTADFNQAWASVVKKYPMLNIFRRKSYGSGSMEEKNVMIDYLRWADEQNKKLVLSDVQVVEETEEEEETVNV